MKHPISITVINNAVGVAPQSNGVMGLFVKAVAVGTTFALGTGYLLTKLDDLTPLGINAAYDVTNTTAVYQQVSEFYAQAGDGALLWLFGVAKATAFADYVVSEPFKALIRGTAVADPANRVKMIGLAYDVPAALQSATDFPADVLATITPLETTRIALFNEGYQFSAIIDGYNMSSTVTPATIGTMANKAAPGVSMCITGTLGNGISAVGLALGRFARISIGHGVGAVEDGPMNTPGAFLTNSIVSTTASVLTVGGIYTVSGGVVTYNAVDYPVGATFTAVAGHTSFTSTAGGFLVENASPVSGLTPAYVDALGTKQYMFLRTWFGKSGFFWNDGATCEVSTKPLSTQEYNRVANALSADALVFFIDQMGKNLPLNAATGAVDQGYLNAKQAEFFDSYINPLTVSSGTGDLTTAALTLSGPDFNTTKTMNFTLQIVPTPILGGVTGTVEFVATI